MEKLNKNLKKMDIWDIGLIKLSVVAGTFFLLTICVSVMVWVQSVNTWYFLVAFVILCARPFYRFWIK